MVPEEGGCNNGRIDGKFGHKGAYEQISEPDMICHYCEEGHTKFICRRLTCKPTQPTRATHVSSVQVDSSLYRIMTMSDEEFWRYQMFQQFYAAQMMSSSSFTVTLAH